MGIINWVRRKAIPWFTGLGITPRTVTLEVRGRRSGKPMRVSLSRTDHAGQQYFIFGGRIRLGSKCTVGGWESDSDFRTTNAGSSGGNISGGACTRTTGLRSETSFHPLGTSSCPSLFWFGAQPNPGGDAGVGGSLRRISNCARNVTLHRVSQDTVGVAWQSPAPPHIQNLCRSSPAPASRVRTMRQVTYTEEETK
jgi:hypothetical protein